MNTTKNQEWGLPELEGLENKLSNETKDGKTKTWVLISGIAAALSIYTALAPNGSCNNNGSRMIQGPGYTEITTLKDNDYKFRRE